MNLSHPAAGGWTRHVTRGAVRATTVALTALAATAADKKPNVIIFLSDDVGYGEYGFQGNKEIPTPNIEDRLEVERAKSGQSREEAERVFLATRQPSGKFVAPDRVAALVALLCGPSGADITGSAMPIDGGWSAA